MKIIRLLIALFAVNIHGTSWATNAPCSGKKGGIAYCENGRFVCHDGSVSQSKKTCMGFEKPKTKNAKS